MAKSSAINSVLHAGDDNEIVIEVLAQRDACHVRGIAFVSLFRACVESLASDDASRLSAMQRAEKTSTNCRWNSTGGYTGFVSAASTENHSTSCPVLKRYRRRSRIRHRSAIKSVSRPH